MGISLKLNDGSAEAVNYHWAEIEQASGRDEYLREGGYAKVAWIGDTAARGFTGEPTPEAAHLLFNGKAGDGERLVPAAKVEAIDLTSGMQKELSILHAVGGPEVRERLDRVKMRVDERVLDVFERHLLHVRIGSGRREAEREVVKATGLVGIRYSHPRNRENEPHAHDHLVISTVVQDPYGDQRRMWIRSTRELRETLGFWGEALMREEVSKEFPGIEWEPVQENGTARIAQFPASLLDALSSRSLTIKRETAEWEKANGRRASSAVKQAITLQTRPPKREVADQSAWTAEMVAIADELGLTQEFIQDRVLGTAPAPRREIPSAAEIADRLLGPEGLTATNTAFRDTDVMVAVIKADIPASQVEEYVDEILADRRVIAIETIKGTIYVTEDLVQAEESIEHAVVDGIDAAPELAVDMKNAHAAIESIDFELTDGQRDVTIAAVTSSDRIVLIEAGAGTGKTTSMLVMNRAYAAQGIGVRGAAPTGIAAVELAAGAGIDTRTVDSLLWEADHGGSISDGGRYQVLAVDEVGMLDSRKFARLLAHTEREGMKLIVMGDSNQLTSVAPGGWLGYFTRSGLKPALRLDEIVRQRDPKHRKAVMDLSRGRPGTWINYQRDLGNIIHLGAGQEHQYGTRAADLLADAAGRNGWGHVLAITPTNMRREVINECVQQSRLAAGELGELLAETGEHELLHVGDRVMYVGTNDRQRNLQNGRVGTVVGKTEQHEIVIGFNDGQTQLRTLSTEHIAGYVRLAYAVTDYKSQGTTLQETVMVGAPEEYDLNRGYVPASRSREQTKLLLISDTTTGDALKKLAQRLRIRQDDDLGIELIQNAKEANMQTAHRAPKDQTRWLSQHRERVDELARELEHIGPGIKPDTSEHDSRISVIDSRRRQIEVEDSHDYGLLRKRGRQDREHQRDLELASLRREREQVNAEVAAIENRAVNDFAERQSISRERTDLIKVAAKEEFERKIGGKHAPWVHEALGPKPPAVQRGLTQRWYRVAEHLAELRVDRGVTDAADPGLRPDDTMLRNDIATLRGHIERVRDLGADTNRFSLMEGKGYRPGRLELPGLLSRSRNTQGFGIGD